MHLGQDRPFRNILDVSSGINSIGKLSVNLGKPNKA
jgi:hypothetical protein